MKKNILKSILAVMLVALTVTGCAKEITPSEVVNTYFTDVKEEEIAAALAEGEETSGTTEEAMTKFLDKLSVKTVSENVDGEKATVEVEVTGLNFGTIMMGMIQEGLASALTGVEISEEEMEVIMLEQIEKSEVETRKGTLNLTKTEDTWEIEQDTNFSDLVFGSIE